MRKQGGLFRRLRLRRVGDGKIYLNRWGFGSHRFGKILLHKMEAPDPGFHLHDHPWWFVSIILWGGYVERRGNTRAASEEGWANERCPLSVATMRLDECHTVTSLNRKTSWSLVIVGPKVRNWGFYTPRGFVPEDQYREREQRGVMTELMQRG